MVECAWTVRSGGTWRRRPSRCIRATDRVEIRCWMLLIQRLHACPYVILENALSANQLIMNSIGFLFNRHLLIISFCQIIHLSKLKWIRSIINVARFIILALKAWYFFFVFVPCLACSTARKWVEGGMGWDGIGRALVFSLTNLWPTAGPMPDDGRPVLFRLGGRRGAEQQADRSVSLSWSGRQPSQTS